jgi:hypothetical protein
MSYKLSYAIRPFQIIKSAKGGKVEGKVEGRKVGRWN